MRRPHPFLVLAALLAALLPLIPLGYVGVRVFELGTDDFVKTVVRERTLELIRNTVTLALTTSLTSLGLGVLTASFLLRLKPRWQRTLLVLAALPLAMPSYVTAFAWVSVPGTPRELLGATLTLVAVNTPFVTLASYGALRAAHRDGYEVARTLGYAPWQAWLRCIAPQIVPAAVAGALLCALYALSDFGAIALMQYETLTWAVDSALAGSFNRLRAAALALLLVTLAVVVVVAERRARGRVVSQATSGARAVQGGGGGLANLGGALLVGLPLMYAALAPIALLFQRLFTGAAEDHDWPRLFASTLNTVGVAAAGALLAVFACLAIAYFAARHPSPLARTIESVALASHAIPGVVAGLALAYLALNVVPQWYQTTLILAIGYAVMFMPKAVGFVRAALEQTSPQLHEVAATLGYGRLRALCVTTLPTILPAVATTYVIVMLTAMKELPATLLLRPNSFNTLATEIWAAGERHAYGAAAPFALTLIIVAALPAFWLGQRTGKDSTSGAAGGS